MNARFIVAALLETEDIDWTPDPADEVSVEKFVDQTVAARQASGIVDKDVAETARVGQWLYHRPTGKRAKVNGSCKLWKREPEKYSLPMKYGLYEYFYITPENAADWSTAPIERGLI